ncbi:nucleotide pyrophosphohydrolase [Corynebacterium breve]|uniref:Nucleotide pyrophosphohydrolase n=1 Tax=Corynebacterium breve TaxID=3049799 RepID=A0ABY8VGM1_9CORY|nr:nucleotide pyrophosphohydrolase [Corynebacterium breve]WIM68237.1 nucleotide pyrophosphohydrolase [Corynebacterium breve]
MQDLSTMEALRLFAQERNWTQFHTPENLAKSIAIEAGELLECFQWDDNSRIERVRLELADVLTYAYFLADALDEIPEALIREKLEITKTKYPVEKSYGSSTKYDEHNGSGAGD